MKRTITAFLLLISVFILNAQNQTQSATATAGTLTVAFSTNSTNTYALAIYITNSSNALVNTMLYRTKNGDSSAADMTTFWSKIGSSWSTSATKLMTNTDLDATSGATATTAYTAKSLYWGKNTSISSIADGSYTVNFEMANYTGSISRRYTSGVFTKGSAAQTVTVPNVTGFTGMTLTWTPVSAGIENVEFSKLYNVYPNPAISSIYASGNDIEEVQICSLTGKILLTSKLQNVNISTLPKGAYLAVIYAKDGMVVKKIEKL
jgi:hypothetical protein